MVQTYPSWLNKTRKLPIFALQRRWRRRRQQTKIKGSTTQNEIPKNLYQCAGGDECVFTRPSWLLFLLGNRQGHIFCRLVHLFQLKEREKDINIPWTIHQQNSTPSEIFRKIKCGFIKTEERVRCARGFPMTEASLGSNWWPAHWNPTGANSTMSQPADKKKNSTTWQQHNTNKQTNQNSIEFVWSWDSWMTWRTESRVSID